MCYNFVDKEETLWYIIGNTKRCFYFEIKTERILVKSMKKIAQFFLGVKKEMGKVRWPNRKEMVKYSVATISFIIVFALFFVGSDAILSAIMKVFQ